MLIFARFYVARRLCGWEHSEAAAYARNMTTARKQMRNLAKWRAERIRSIRTPFEESV